MKIEFEYPEDELILQYLHSPTMAGGPAFRHLPEDHASRPWIVYTKSVKSKTYFGAIGIGMMPQAAINDALSKTRAYCDRHPQGAYATSKPPLNLALDLDF